MQCCCVLLWSVFAILIVLRFLVHELGVSKLLGARGGLLLMRQSHLHDIEFVIVIANERGPRIFENFSPYAVIDAIANRRRDESVSDDRTFLRRADRAGIIQNWRFAIDQCIPWGHVLLMGRVTLQVWPSGRVDDARVAMDVLYLPVIHLVYFIWLLLTLWKIYLWWHNSSADRRVPDRATSDPRCVGRCLNIWTCRILWNLLPHWRCRKRLAMRLANELLWFWICAFLRPHPWLSCILTLISVSRGILRFLIHKRQFVVP